MENKVVAQRDITLDVIKGVLIFLVVLAHFAVSKKVGLPIRAWGNAIYAFHMPAFIFISGYLSKRVTAQRTKEIDTLLWPFLVFQVLMLIYSKLTGYGGGGINLFETKYLNWYILALFFWRLIIPYCAKIKHYVAIVFALGIAFFAGYFVDNSILTLYRVFYFFPVFLLGYYVDDLKASVSKLFRFKFVGPAVLIFGSFAIILFSSQSESNWSLIHYAFAPDFNYDGQTSAMIWGGVRIVGYAVSLIMTYSFFSTCVLLSQRLQWIANLGKNSMTVYIVHGFFTLALVPLVIVKCDWIVGSALSLVFAIILCWFLSRKKVVNLFKPLVDLGELSKLLHYSIYK